MPGALVFTSGKSVCWGGSEAGAGYGLVVVPLRHPQGPLERQLLSEVEVEVTELAVLLLA